VTAERDAKSSNGEWRTGNEEGDLRLKLLWRIYRELVSDIKGTLVGIPHHNNLYP
jgi:hypothetical protein